MFKQIIFIVVLISILNLILTSIMAGTHLYKFYMQNPQEGVYLSLWGKLLIGWVFFTIMSFALHSIFSSNLMNDWEQSGGRLIIVDVLVFLFILLNGYIAWTVFWGSSEDPYNIIISKLLNLDGPEKGPRNSMRFAILLIFNLLLSLASYGSWGNSRDPR